VSLAASMRTAVAWAALAPALLAQVQVPSPNPLRPAPEDRTGLMGIEGLYGPAQPEELSAIAYGGKTYQRRHVITRGILGILEPGRYLSLTEGTARVMVIPSGPADYRDYESMIGMDVDVTGIVRVLPQTQKVLPHCGLESKCEDPLLPELPNARIEWPTVSITVWKVADRGTSGRGRGDGPRTLADTGIEAAAADRKPVRALGQFRGANLCGDLPSASRRDPADWVILTHEGPVWVTGRRPEGKGFRLDPAYRADTARWLEVTGRVEAAGDVRYVRARKVALVARPADTGPVPCAP